MIAFLPNWVLALQERSKAFARGSLGRRVVAGYSWSIVASLMSRGLAVAASFFVARILGLEKFGELGIVLNTISMTSIFGGLGMGITASKYIAELRDRDTGSAGELINIVNWLGAVASIVLSLALFVSAVPFATSVLAAGRLAPEIRVASILIFINTMIGIQTGILTAFERFKALALINLLSGLVSLPLLIIGAAYLGLEGAVSGYLMMGVVQWAANARSLKLTYASKSLHPIHGFRIRLVAKYKGVLMHYSLPALLLNLVTLPTTWMVSIILVNCPNGYSEMGILNAITQWRNAVLYIPNIISQAAVPILSSLLGSGEAHKIRKVVSLNFKLYSLVTIPMVILLSVMSGFVVSLYGSGFEKGASAFVLLQVAVAFQVLAIPIGQYMSAKGEMWLGLAMNVVWAVMFVTLGTWLVKSGYGAEGVAVAYLCSYAAHLIWALLYWRHTLKAGVDLKRGTGDLVTAGQLVDNAGRS